MPIEEITKIPPDELAKVVEEYTVLKAEIEVKKETDGTFTVRATLPDKSEEHKP